MAWVKLAFDSDVVKKADYTTKGDVLIASGANTPTVLGVGANGTVLEAASGETTGVKWGTAAAGDFKADGSVPMTGNLDFAKKEATAMALDNQASAPGTPVLGQMYYNTGTNDAWLNTSV